MAGVGGVATESPPMVLSDCASWTRAGTGFKLRGSLRLVRDVPVHWYQRAWSRRASFGRVATGRALGLVRQGHRAGMARTG